MAVEKEKTFETSFYCTNCRNWSTFTFPHGTRIRRPNHYSRTCVVNAVKYGKDLELVLDEKLTCKHCGAYTLE